MTAPTRKQAPRPERPGILDDAAECFRVAHAMDAYIDTLEAELERLQAIEKAAREALKNGYIRCADYREDEEGMISCGTCAACHACGALEAEGE